MKKFRFTGLLLLVCMLISGVLYAPTAFAANTAEDVAYRYEEPYVFNYTDEATSEEHWVYMAYDAKDETYLETYEVRMDREGSIYACYPDGLVFKHDAFRDIGFDDAGRLYIVTHDGRVRRMKNPSAGTYFTTGAINARELVLDDDDLVYAVKSSNGTVTKLNDLKFNDEIDIVTGKPVVRRQNYVSTSRRADGGIIYDAFRDGTLLLRTHCKGSNVWLETAKVLLSNKAVGAKFVGYTKNYEPLLLNMDGRLYLFPYKDYKNPYVIALKEKVVSYNRDDNGFVYSVKTEKATYLVDKLFDDRYPNRPAEKVTVSYVANEKNCATAYRNNKVYAVLELGNGKLYWNGTYLSNSNNVKAFGIAENGVPYWINGTNLYTLRNDTVTYVNSGVSKLRFAKSGKGTVEAYLTGNAWHGVPSK